MKQNISKDELIEALVENYMSKKPAFVFEHTATDYNAYMIEVYTANNLEDKEYITRNRYTIKEFLDAGYERAHLGAFVGCRDAKAVKKNTAMLKIARDKATDQILAMSIYSARWGGLKCVGITAIVTDNPVLRRIAIDAVKQIVREDVKLWGQFVWTECSGKVEQMWEQYGGIKIPSAYLPLFMDENTLESVSLYEDDPYKYSRIVSKGTSDEKRFDKVIYGFPTREVLEKYIKDKDTTLDKLCQEYGIDPETVLNEGFCYRDAPEVIWPQMKLIRHYYDEFKRGRMELTEKEMDVLTKSVNKICSMMEPIWDKQPANTADGLWKMMFYAVTTLNQCNVLRIYEFGVDVLQVDEQERFPTDAMIGDITFVDETFMYECMCNVNEIEKIC